LHSFPTRRSSDLHGLTTFRLGRAFHAVRDNETLASAASIDPLKYRMLAFVIGGAVAGGVGTLYVSYVGVLCPGELAVSLSVNLLVMLFLGRSEEHTSELQSLAY